MFYCGTDNCSLRYIEMPQKALEEFAESYQDRLKDCERIGNLNEELIRTRKALDVAVDVLNTLLKEKNEHTQPDLYVLTRALKEITALEQKD